MPDLTQLCSCSAMQQTARCHLKLPYECALSQQCALPAKQAAQSQNDRITDAPLPAPTVICILHSPGSFTPTSTSSHRTALQDELCEIMPDWAVRAGARERVYFDPHHVIAAVVTCGGLCPGLNDVVQGIVRKLEDYGVPEGKVLGIRCANYGGLSWARRGTLCGHVHVCFRCRHLMHGMVASLCDADAGCGALVQRTAQALATSAWSACADMASRASTTRSTSPSSYPAATSTASTCRRASLLACGSQLEGGLRCRQCCRCMRCSCLLRGSCMSRSEPCSSVSQHTCTPGRVPCNEPNSQIFAQLQGNCRAARSSARAAAARTWTRS